MTYKWNCYKVEWKFLMNLKVIDIKYLAERYFVRGAMLPVCTSWCLERFLILESVPKYGWFKEMYASICFRCMCFEDWQGQNICQNSKQLSCLIAMPELYILINLQQLPIACMYQDHCIWNLHGKLLVFLLLSVLWKLKSELCEVKDDLELCERSWGFTGNIVLVIF